MQHSQNNTNNRDARREENRWKEYNRLRYSKVFFLYWSPYKSIDFNLAIDTVKYLFFPLLSVFFNRSTYDSTMLCYTYFSSLLSTFAAVWPQANQFRFFCRCFCIVCECVSKCLSVWKCIELARIGNSLGKSISKIIIYVCLSSNKYARDEYKKN